jgi:short-subunit dehydrogenase
MSHTSSFPFTSALVTGASSGIGWAMTEQLAAAGVSTVVVARRGDRLADLAAQHPDAVIEPLVADLTTPDGVAAVAARLTDAARPIDLLVNNAGFGHANAFGSLAADDLDAEIRLNVSAVVALTHAAVSAMAARRRGWVLNTSSVAGFQPGPNLAVYAATKSFVTTFSESLHEELRSSGIVVTALCPGLTKTEFQSVSGSDAYAGGYPEMVWTSAEDVARAGLTGCAHGRAVVVPGAVNKVLVTSTHFVPRSLVRRGAGMVMGNMRTPS